ncbi:MAG: hypothetical protein F6K47_11015 [Symploca sp. SIO2E6]|nr:hypothetical protein [Symploca sp. SIO2E6]
MHLKNPIYSFSYYCHPVRNWELGIGNWELGIGNWELGIFFRPTLFPYHLPPTT